MKGWEICSGGEAVCSFPERYWQTGLLECFDIGESLRRVSRGKLSNRFLVIVVQNSLCVCLASIRHTTNWCIYPPANELNRFYLFWQWCLWRSDMIFKKCVFFFFFLLLWGYLFSQFSRSYKTVGGWEALYVAVKVKCDIREGMSTWKTWII